MQNTFKMYAVPCPCYDNATSTDCPQRHVNCHAECDKWQDYLARKNAEIERRRVAEQPHKDVRGCGKVIRGMLWRTKHGRDKG